MKTKICILILSIITLYSSCSKSSTATDTSTGTTFTHSVKAIFDKCATCHASGKSNSNDWLYNSANYETSIKNNINKIYPTVNSTSASMSQKAGLNSTEVNAIKNWYAAGYPAQ